MPRQARLDAPGTLHHVIIRGIEQGKIVDNREDRQNFVSRMGKVASDTGTAIYACPLMPNHLRNSSQLVGGIEGFKGSRIQVK